MMKSLRHARCRQVCNKYPYEQLMAQLKPTRMMSPSQCDLTCLTSHTPMPLSHFRKNDSSQRGRSFRSSTPLIFRQGVAGIACDLAEPFFPESNPARFDPAKNLKIRFGQLVLYVWIPAPQSQTWGGRGRVEKPQDLDPN